MPVETLSGNLMGRCVTPISEDHGERFGVPSLEELGKEAKHSKQQSLNHRRVTSQQPEQEKKNVDDK